MNQTNCSSGGGLIWLLSVSHHGRACWAPRPRPEPPCCRRILGWQRWPWRCREQRPFHSTGGQQAKADRSRSRSKVGARIEAKDESHHNRSNHSSAYTPAPQPPPLPATQHPNDAEVQTGARSRYATAAAPAPAPRSAPLALRTQHCFASGRWRLTAHVPLGDARREAQAGGRADPRQVPGPHPSHRIPVIVEKADKSDIVDIDKKKCVAPCCSHCWPSAVIGVVCGRVAKAPLATAAGSRVRAAAPAGSPEPRGRSISEL